MDKTCGQCKWAKPDPRGDASLRLCKAYEYWCDGPMSNPINQARMVLDFDRSDCPAFAPKEADNGN